MYYFVKNLLEPLFVFIKAILSDSSFLNKHENWNLRIWGWKDAKIPTSIQSTWTLEYQDLRMQGNQQAPEVHEPKDMTVWGCEDNYKHPEYINLRICGWEDVRIPTSTRSTWTWGYEDLRMWGYQQASRVHEPKDMRMWGYEDTSKHARPEDMRMQGCKWMRMNLRIWGCKDARIQASTNEHKDIRMRGCKDTSKCTGT